MAHKIVDTNVPLTASGRNPQATEECRRQCDSVISRVLRGDIVVVLDEDGSAINEYRRNMYPDLKGSRAGQFLMYLLLNRRIRAGVYNVSLALDSGGRYEDYPDNEDNWTTTVPRCERFDPDDKKWVALAVRFKKDTGTDAPIVNAADRCWLAFESHLESAGIRLETLCREERQRDS